MSTPNLPRILTLLALVVSGAGARATAPCEDGLTEPQRELVATLVDAGLLEGRAGVRVVDTLADVHGGFQAWSVAESASTEFYGHRQQLLARLVIRPSGRPLVLIPREGLGPVEVPPFAGESTVRVQRSREDKAPLERRAGASWLFEPSGVDDPARWPERNRGAIDGRAVTVEKRTGGILHFRDSEGAEVLMKVGQTLEFGDGSRFVRDAHEVRAVPPAGTGRWLATHLRSKWARQAMARVHLAFDRMILDEHAPEIPEYREATFRSAVSDEPGRGLLSAIVGPKNVMGERWVIVIDEATGEILRPELFRAQPQRTVELDNGKILFGRSRFYFFKDDGGTPAAPTAADAPRPRPGPRPLEAAATLTVQEKRELVN